MFRTISWHQWTDVADALVTDSAVFISLDEGIAQHANDLLTRCEAFLRSGVELEEDEKTMFPKRLGQHVSSERSVLQFKRCQPVPAVVPSEILDMVTPLAAFLGGVATTLLAFSGLDLERSRALSLCDPREWVLNAVHYPSLPGSSGTLRFPPHRDWGILALYPAIRGAGLQAQMSGKWRDVVPPPNTMFLYAGQTLTKMSDGRIPSLPHRVVQMTEDGRGALIYYADASRTLRFPDGETVGEYIDAKLRKIGQIP